MASSKFQKAIGAVKDNASIGLAKVGSSNTLADLEVAIVKATSHEEYPADEKYIREILSLTSYSRALISACINTISRRLNKTRNWVVALKTLMLVQRVLTEGDPAYEQEIFFATRRGTRLLNMSDFRDARSDSWDYSAFVRTYALYLDERLEFQMQGRHGKPSMFSMEDCLDDEEQTGAICVRSTPVCEMRTELIFSKTQHLQQVLERFLACRPTGEAKHNRVVIVALYSIVKESFQLYFDITEILGILIDRFMELEEMESVKVFDIFRRVSKQYDELDAFYAWCKTVGVARSSEYPEVEKISQKKLELMDEFIRDKSALAQTRNKPLELENEPEPEPEPVEEEEDMHAMKALPAPDPVEQVVELPKEEPKEEIKEHDTRLEADLLNLGADALTSEQHADKLALALFDAGGPARPTSGVPIWEAFKKDTADWESALVQSASHLDNQQATLPGGFDMLLLDGMYQQGTTTAAMAQLNNAAGGSASSVALGSAGRPAMLALPAPPTPNGSGNATAGADPFAASLAVAPPAFVQMSELEKKQRLLMEEQLMWQQYANNGMQGHLGMGNVQPYPYNNMGGYARGY